jgi:hypothetical protein
MMQSFFLEFFGGSNIEIFQFPCKMAHKLEVSLRSKSQILHQVPLVEVQSAPTIGTYLIFLHQGVECHTEQASDFVVHQHLTPKLIRKKLRF